MSKTSELRDEIRRWNAILFHFGFCPANPNNERALISLIVRPLLVISILSVFILLQFVSVETEKYVSFEDNSSRCVHMLSNIMVIMHICLTFYKIKECTNIQTELIKFEKTYCFKGNSNLWCYLLFPVVSVTLFLMVDVVQYTVFDEVITTGDILPTVSGHFLELCNVLHVVQISLHLSWLRRMIVFINIQLHRLAALTHAKNPDSQKLALRQDKRKICGMSIQRSDSDGAAEINELTDEEGLRRVKFCRILYHETYLLSQEVNDAFATRNLIMVSSNVVTGIIFLYPAVSDIVAALSTTLEITSGRAPITVEHIIFHFKWSIASLLAIFGVIWASRLTTTEAFHTVCLVYEILSDPLERNVKMELHRFTLQIRQNEIKFSPHDFFALDNKLFLSIFATFVSYLIILVQFRG